MATIHTSTKSLNTTPPMKFKDIDDITPETLNIVLTWLTTTLMDIQDEERSVDDRLTALE